jgi:ABC-2 type transport system ATP-binding protein
MTIFCKEITMKYGFSTILDKITLEIPPGIFGLLGVNGAGKTTLINILATITRPSSGKIFFNDMCIHENEYAYKKIMGYSPQEASLPVNHSVFGTFSYLAELKGIYKNREEEISELLDKIDFLELKDKKVNKLSHGQQKLISITQAFLGDPQVILLDEPFSNLDPIYIQKIKKLLNEYKYKASIIITEHNLDAIEDVCTHISIINKGNIKVHGNIHKILCTNHILSVQVTQVHSTFIDKLQKIKGIKNVSINGTTLTIVYTEDVFDKVYKILKKDIISIKRGKSLFEAFLEYSY